MKERQPRFTEIERGEFYRLLVLTKTAISQQLQSGVITMPEAQMQILNIDLTVKDLECAEEHDLRVRYYQDDLGQLNYKVESKDRAGFKDVKK